MADTMTTWLIYALIIFGHTLPIYMLICLIKLTPPSSKVKLLLVWLLGIIASIAYLGILLWPALYYITVDSVSDPIASTSPWDQYILGTATSVLIGFVFCGSIVAACIKYLRSND